ncbi:MAG: hypothetical protein B9S32_13995 [Verrucomicrobia bacterium Tous-C9LFEB]|nr:MAG: hypothetical protein B9S32_13995 [Verrucomicrobia bacterium Tous-C9LFEB]
MVSEYTQLTQKVTDYDLAATLSSGQAFCWDLTGPNEWRGWIAGNPVSVVRGSDCFRLTGRKLTRDVAARYFQWDTDLAALIKTFPQDEPMRQALAYCPGLRLLRQDPWETTANFICSAMKQIVQIKQINRALRQRFGKEVEPGQWSFPDWRTLAAASEADLRECKLGFRAKHLFHAAWQLTAGEVSLEAVESLPTPEARKELMKLRGVGEKVASCILLFAYGRQDVFPVDVWVRRAIHQLYFPKRRTFTEKQARIFVAKYFGPYGGYAQQYLFHWIRTVGALPPSPRLRG